MKRSLIPCAMLVLLATVAHAITITHDSTSINMDFVTVGDPGNANDTEESGYGSVDYVYDIGKYEVSAKQWAAVVAANTNDLLDNLGTWSGNQPVGNVSMYDAAMFCNWLTSGDVTKGAYAINGNGQVTGINRNSAQAMYGTIYAIPAKHEWYKAAFYDPGKAGGAGYWDYPTKQDGPIPPDGIDSNGDPQFDAVFNDGFDQGHPNDVDNAGVLSAYGTMGQGGNVAELYETDNTIGLGGAWNGQSSSLHATYPGYGSSDPSDKSNKIGFRVVQVGSSPEPSKQFRDIDWPGSAERAVFLSSLAHCGSTSVSGTLDLRTVEGDVVDLRCWPYWGFPKSTIEDEGGFIPESDAQQGGVFHKALGGILGICAVDDCFDWFERATIEVNGVILDIGEISGPCRGTVRLFDIAGEADILEQINQTGQLHYTITATKGDFCLSYVGIQVDVMEYGGTEIFTPEPSVITLLLCGAVTGLIWRRRRR